MEINNTAFWLETRLRLLTLIGGNPVSAEHSVCSQWKNDHSKKPETESKSLDTKTQRALTIVSP